MYMKSKSKLAFFHIIYWGEKMYKIYQINNNDTLESIANYFNVNLDEMKKINGIIDNMELTKGSLIIVPSSENSENYKKYIVKKGDNLYSIAKNYNVDLDTLLKLNGLEKDDYIYPNEEILIPNKNMYIVEKNDTLFSVAKKLGKSVNELSNLNDNIYLKEDQTIIF